MVPQSKLSRCILQGYRRPSYGALVGIVLRLLVKSSEASVSSSKVRVSQLLSTTSTYARHACLVGLRAPHERGWVHRDVGVGNILIVTGIPKIADLGHAKRVNDDSEVHQKLVVCAWRFLSRRCWLNSV